MNKSNLEPDYQTFAATLKSCAAKFNIKLGKCLHSSVIKHGLHSCVLVSKSLLNMYAKCKALDDCHILFNQITHPDAVTWNIMLSGLAGTRIHDLEVIKLYNAMNLVQHFKPSSVTVAIVLPVCVRLKSLNLGKNVHSYAIKSGLESQTLVGNALVSLYFKLGCVSGDAYQVFDEMSERDVVSWNAMVAGLVENGMFPEAFSMFRQMIVEGTSPNYATIANILPICTHHFGKQIHCYTIRREELFLDTSVTNSLLGFYSKTKQMKEAESLFTRMHSKDLVSWNSMIAGYTSNGEWLKALQFFQKSNFSSNLPKPDSVTFLTLLSTCTNLQNLKSGKQIHGYITRNFNLNNMTPLGNSLINFYSKCRDFLSAFHSFSLIHNKDLISWNSILLALAEGQLVVDFTNQLHSMFSQSIKPDSITIITALQLGGMVKEAHGYSLRSHLLLYTKEPTLGNSLIDAYSKSQNMEYALKVFKTLSIKNIVTSNSLISGYINSGSHKNADIIFKNMTERDLTTWNLMIRVYADNGDNDQALNLFHELHKNEIKPDFMTIMSILPVVTKMASMEMVKQCHGYVVRGCFHDVQLIGALLDSYSKCGSLNYACRIFQTTAYKDLVMFTSMVGGYAMHGMGEKALICYFQMLEKGEKPDHVVITAVLSGCSHSGLVDQGLKIFDSIDSVHKLKPTMEQYVCVVDLLARNGRINDAYRFIKNMNIEPNANVWGALLGACKNHGDVEMGCVVADELLGIEGNDLGNYVVMSNIYAGKGKWEEVMEIRRLMKTKDLKKPAGCSWIEIDGRKNVFIAGDSSHPLRLRIADVLGKLDIQVKERFKKLCKIEKAKLETNLFGFVVRLIMEETEGGISFDFEGGLETGPTQPTASVPVIHRSTDLNSNNDNDPSSASAVNVNSASGDTPAAVTAPNFSGRRSNSYRQTVCRHWLRGLCMKGETCGFLHQYDKSRMPICRFFRLYGECREQDCVYKHTTEDIKECNMYKLGFCPNGPDCRYRHAKLPGPPPPVQEILQKVHQLNSNRFFQNRNFNHSQQSEKPQLPHGVNSFNQVVIIPTTTDSTTFRQIA
ncbi:hypothetical protein LXL04_010954 [Taraxacum kok-saghyz]